MASINGAIFYANILRGKDLLEGGRYLPLLGHKWEDFSLGHLSVKISVRLLKLVMNAM